ncbi:STAS domain-containing protein [Spirulina sp. CS-785/01]|uniref:STAS domain-containing protein n=1 Tax=Spirulina sp. CS-785/01 TaxID=3021716 RepID=UPI00232D773E|nr:STAS domain-containing protein [Spirulina sp. CS-785/01]MDB9315397.1 STAS domain-containing protein [Spirulina sp. CS-785/01]
MQTTRSPLNGTVISLKDLLHLSSSLDVKQYLIYQNSLTLSNHSVVWIDFSEVSNLDSQGLMILVTLIKLARQLGKRLIGCSASASIQMILELTNLDQVLETQEAELTSRVAA